MSSLRFVWPLSSWKIETQNAVSVRPLTVVMGGYLTRILSKWGRSLRRAKITVVMLTQRSDVQEIRPLPRAILGHSRRFEIRQDRRSGDNEGSQTRFRQPFREHCSSTRHQKVQSIDGNSTPTSTAEYVSLMGNAGAEQVWRLWKDITVIACTTAENSEHRRESGAQLPLRLGPCLYASKSVVLFRVR